MTSGWREALDLSFLTRFKPWPTSPAKRILWTIAFLCMDKVNICKKQFSFNCISSKQNFEKLAFRSEIFPLQTKNPEITITNKNSWNNNVYLPFCLLTDVLGYLFGVDKLRAARVDAALLTLLKYYLNERRLKVIYNRKQSVNQKHMLWVSTSCSLFFIVFPDDMTPLVMAKA